MNVREAAYETLILCEKEKLFTNIALDNALVKYRFEAVDRALFTMLVYGVTERRITLDYIIREMTGKSIGRLDKSVVCLLRLGIFQIKFCDRIPENAAVDETVKLASRHASRAKGFINGVLRSVCRKDISYPLKTELIHYLSVLYSVSPDICALLSEQYCDCVEEILSAFSEQPGITLNVNTLKTTREDLMKEIGDALPCAVSQKGVRMKGNTPVSELNSLSDGRCFVQDEASQIAVAVLDAQPGMTVVDCCACPGGKSFSAAVDMRNEGTLYSFDLHENKLSLVENGAEKLGITIIHTKQHDSTEALPELRGKADRVICDVPCSGIGVIPKKPDLRYKTAESFSELPALQYSILCAASEYLKSNGVLVYSTCTLNKHENEETVNRFLVANPDFEAVDFEIGNIRSHDGMLTLLPQVNHTDGFFIAKLKRITERA